MTEHLCFFVVGAEEGRRGLRHPSCVEQHHVRARGLQDVQIRKRLQAQGLQVQARVRLRVRRTFYSLLPDSHSAAGSTAFGLRLAVLLLVPALLPGCNCPGLAHSLFINAHPLPLRTLICSVGLLSVATQRWTHRASRRKCLRSTGSRSA